MRPCLSKALPAMAGLSAPARLIRASGIGRDQAERDPDLRLDVLPIVLDDDGTDQSNAVQEGHIPDLGLNS